MRLYETERPRAIRDLAERLFVAMMGQTVSGLSHQTGSPYAEPVWSPKDAAPEALRQATLFYDLNYPLPKET